MDPCEYQTIIKLDTSENCKVISLANRLFLFFVFPILLNGNTIISRIPKSRDKHPPKPSDHPRLPSCALLRAHLRLREISLLKSRLMMFVCVCVCVCVCMCVCVCVCMYYGGLWENCVSSCISATIRSWRTKLGILVKLIGILMHDI